MAIYDVPGRIIEQEEAGLLGRVKGLEEEVKTLKQQMAELLLIYGIPDGLRNKPSIAADSNSDSER